MNALDAYVAEVLSEPFEKYGRWWVTVAATCWSPEVYKTDLMFNSKEEAYKVEKGYKFVT